MSYKLPQLKYSYDALEPFIDTKTMETHHSKHHQTYVDRFNAAIAGKPDLEKIDGESLIANIDQVPEEIRTAVRNNGGGAVNHTFYWDIIAPKTGGEPQGHIGDAINSLYGSFAGFKAKFSDAAVTQFGSGWAWLVLAKDGKLEIVKTANQDTPLSSGKKPLLAIDVWEHAYYLKYQNRRPEYVEAFFNVINWRRVDELYTFAKNSSKPSCGCSCC